jgi:DNA-directed RNA polymerase specialized sigma24 family protein
MCRTILVMIGDPAAAEDITQDAFVRLHWGKVSRNERPGAWVRRVPFRPAVRHLQREGLRRLLEAAWEPGGSSSDVPSGGA